MTTKLAYNLTEAAHAVGLSPKTLKRAVAAGALKAKRSDRDDQGNPTGRYLISAKALQEWFDGLEAA